MKRIVRRDEYVVVVENIREARDQRQLVHLRLHDIRVRILRDGLRYPSRDELIDIVSRAGFRDIEAYVRDYDLCSTPVLYYLDTRKYSDIDKQLVRKYFEAIRFVHEYGEVSTPVMIVKAWK